MKQAESRDTSVSTVRLRKTAFARRAARILLMAALLSACSAFQETPAQKAQRIDTVLSASGFQMVAADSPKRQQVLASTPPLTMRYYVAKDGKPRYFFADPYQCNCLYEGDEKAYQRYQYLRLQQKLVKEEEQAAELNQSAAMQMNMYDPFFFPY
jgi:hypothetical protein